MEDIMYPLDENQECNVLVATLAVGLDSCEPRTDSSESAPHHSGTPSSSKPRTKAESCTGTHNNRKKPTTLPNETVEYLKAWMMSPEHIAHPYPTEVEKAKIMEDTGLELKQLTNWFVNNRKRYWKPRVEASLLKNQEGSTSTLAMSSPTIQRNVSLSLPTTEDHNGGSTPSANADITSPTRSSKRRMSKDNHINKENTEKSLPIAVSPSSVAPSMRVHLVSGHNSEASMSDGTTSCSDSDEERYTATSTAPRVMELPIQEAVDVYILRPISPSLVPDLSDVTLLANVPSERILRTYSNCMLTYYQADSKKSKHKINCHSYHRDSEISRIKKYYLSRYLTEQENISSTSITTTDTLAPSQPSTPLRKRKQDVHVIPTNDGTNNTAGASACSFIPPRPKYRRYSIDIWKEACQTANHVYDDDELPSLEEATRLFGYTN
jgi:Homeobox KN domain